MFNIKNSKMDLFEMTAKGFKFIKFKLKYSMNTSTLKSYVFLAFFMLFSCNKDKNEEPKYDHIFKFTFNESLNNWQGGFADYFPDPETGSIEHYELDFGHEFLPSPLDKTQKALMISSHNRSDDIFMFIKHQISGLEPSSKYLLVADIQLASQYPKQSVGIGGSPGSSVYLKLGATSIKPAPVLVEEAEVEIYRMNIDIGNQSQGGKDMVVIGDIGTLKDDFVYVFINRSNKGKPFTFSTDAEGKAWVIIGTDSGFEGKTTLYYNMVTLKLLKK
jgi:hypothetical protein